MRKQTVEPVFGIVKRVMGWCQTSMRGLNKAGGEWSLVTMVWKIKNCMRCARLVQRGGRIRRPGQTH